MLCLLWGNLLMLQVAVRDILEADMSSGGDLRCGKWNPGSQPNKIVALISPRAGLGDVSSALLSMS